MSNRVQQRRNWQRKIKEKACARRRKLLNSGDLISKLPNDVLIQIISLLTMKEAGRTSVLSNRWRHMWVDIPILNFHSRELINKLKLSRFALQVEAPKYVHWVDQVVSTHQAPTIDEFRVGFQMNTNLCVSSFDKWVRFAMEKRVKMLEIDLSLNGGNHADLYHTFPPSLSFSSRLTSLELGCVDITGEVVESCLHNCPALECLSVKYSTALVELSVTGPSLKLKLLRIFRCYKFKKLEISAPNLVSFHYQGHDINLKLGGMPKLREVSIGQFYVENLDKSFSDLSSYASQIEVFSVAIYAHLQDIRMFARDYAFTRLKKLELEITPCPTDEIDCLTSLLEASPLLHHLKLTVSHDDNEEPFEEDREEFMKPVAFPHYQLKIVEYFGFIGCPLDMDIATFLIECAISVDKFNFDTRVLCCIGGPPEWEFRETPVRERARKFAKQLAGQMKDGTQLEIF